MRSFMQQVLSTFSRIVQKDRNLTGTLLAYAKGTFPFSEKLVKRNVRFALRTACDYVDREEKAGR